MTEKTDWASFESVDAPAAGAVDWSSFEVVDDATESRPKSGVMRKLGDLGLGFASGATGATKAIADAAGADNDASRALHAVDNFVNRYLSPEAQADKQMQSAILQEAEGKGLFEEVKAGVRAFGVAPLQTAVTGLGSVAPILAGAFAAPAALPAAAVGGSIGVMMGAGTVKGSIFDDIKRRSLAAGMSESEATEAAIRAQEYGGENTGQIAIGAGLGAADAVTGVSAAATRMARAALGRQITGGSTRGVLGRGTVGVAKEMPVEFAQGGQERYAQNSAAQKAGYEVDPWSGVAGQGTMEALASAGPGAAFGIMNKTGSPAPEAIPQTEPQPEPEPTLQLGEQTADPSIESAPTIADIDAAISVDDAIKAAQAVVDAPARGALPELPPAYPGALTQEQAAIVAGNGNAGLINSAQQNAMTQTEALQRQSDTLASDAEIDRGRSDKTRADRMGMLDAVLNDDGIVGIKSKLARFAGDLQRAYGGTVTNPVITEEEWARARRHSNATIGLAGLDNVQPEPIAPTLGTPNQMPADLVREKALVPAIVAGEVLPLPEQYHDLARNSKNVEQFWKGLNALKVPMAGRGPLTAGYKAFRKAPVTAVPISGISEDAPAAITPTRSENTLINVPGTQNNVLPAAPINGKSAPITRPKTHGDRVRATLRSSDSFLSLLATEGVSSLDRADVGLDRGSIGNRLVPGHGPVVRRNGLRLDALALRAFEDGHLTQADMDHDGGVSKLSDMIRRAVAGREVVRSDASHLDGQSNDDALMQEASSLGIETAGKTADQVYDELVARDADMQPAHTEQDIDELLGSPADMEAGMRSMGFTEEEISDERNRQGAQTGTGPVDGESSTATARSGIAGNEAQTEEFSLEGETAAEAGARVAAEDQQQKDDKAEQSRLNEVERKAGIDKEIAQRQQASADNFQLGQSAEDGLAGQGDIFAQAQQAESILDAANITGAERLTALKDIKKGEITVDELARAHPAKEPVASSKPAPVKPMEDEAESQEAKDESTTIPVHISASMISSETAARAFSGTSFSPEKRGESTKSGFVDDLTVLRDKFVKAYHAASAERKAAFVEAFDMIAAKYAAMTNAYLSAHSLVMSSMIAGPARFPVESNRKKSETADKRAQEANDYLRKASKTLTRALTGPLDNSVNAEIADVENKLAQREKRQTELKAINVALRKGDDQALRDMGLDDAAIAKLKTPDYAGRTGIPAYEITNNGAEVRRLRLRVDELKARAALADAATEEDEDATPGVRMVRNAEAGRLQLFFDGKPSEAIRTELKGAAFKWAPSTGAWQRQLTENAVFAAEKIIASHAQESNNGNIALEEWARGPGSAFDQSLHADIESGADAKSILTRIVNESDNASNRAIAQQLLDHGVTASIEIGTSDGQQFQSDRPQADFVASYWPKGNMVTLFQSAGAERNLVHELVHSVTFNALKKGGIAALRMKALYAEVKRNGTLSGQYGMENIDEFVAESHSNPVFQSKLEAIALKEGSAWNRFVGIVRSILGMQKADSTMLDAVLRTGRELMGENADVDVSDGSILGNVRPGTWDAPAPSVLDNFIYRVQNKHIDMKEVQQAIRATSGQIRDTVNAYLKEELFHGRSATRIDAFLNDELNPLIAAMRLNKVEQEDLGQYLHAKHAKEANAHIAKINPGEPDMQDGGSGMTNKESSDYLAALTPAKRAMYESLAKRVYAITKATRQQSVDYGLMSQADKDMWESSYQFYVPLQRADMDTMAHGTGSGQGYSIRGAESRRRTGSRREVVYIIANIANARDKAVVRGEKNRVGLALFGLAKENPNPDFWKVDKPPVLRVVETIGGVDQVVERIDPMYKSKDNVVMVKIVNPSTGKVDEHAILFNERNERAVRMAASIKNLDGTQLGELLGAAAKVTRYFSAINTQYNPIFGVVNIVRDTQGAMLNLTDTPLAGKQGKILADVGKILYGAAKHGMRGFDGQWKTLSEEFAAAGGKTGYKDMYAIGTDRSEAIQHALDPDWWTKTKWGKALTVNGYLEAPMAIMADKGARPVMDWLSSYNEVMENTVRLAAYKEAKAAGMTIEQAASMAKNLTVNFNRKGEMATQAGALYAFFNAAVQGQARMISALKGPAGKRIIGGGILLGAMQALLLAAAGFGDDEPPEFVRERNLILPIGDNKYLTLPMPLGFNVLPNIGRLSMELVLSGGSGAMHKIESLLAVIVDATNPLGGSAPMAQIISPTITDPIVSLGMNKDWTGKPISREDFNSLNPTPGFTRSKDVSSAPAKWVAEAINTMTGGTKYKQGIASPTADQIEYLVGQVTGGVGRELGKVATTTETMLTGEELPEYKMPLVGRFYGATDGQSSQGNAFYNNLRKMNAHEATIKGLRLDHKGGEAMEYLRDNPDARLFQFANTAERRVGKLRQMKRKLIESGASKERIKIIELRITSEMARMNQRVDQLQEAN